MPLRRSSPRQGKRFMWRRSSALPRRSTLVGCESHTCQYAPFPSTKVRYAISIYALTRILSRINTNGVQEKCHLTPPLLRAKYLFSKGLSAETGQRFAHHVDHGFGRPAVPAIV